jgi:methionyl-tRNA formyltransferase
MKAIVFAYHDIGCVGLQALVDAGYDVQAVFTHTDAPNENQFFSSVARVGADLNLPVYAPEDVNHPLWVDRIRALQPDVIFSFYYRNMLSEDIVGQQKVTITADDTALKLHAKVREAAKELLTKLLPEMKAGKISLTPQDETQASYFGRRTAADGEIHWYKSATEINNLIRAVTEPYPGAFSYLGQRKLTIWRARPLATQHDKQPGTVLSSDPLTIACGEGALEVLAGQSETGLYVQGSRLALELGIDRVIWAYGAKEGLKFTLFRPFNWMGPRLDNQLVDGGEQKRCFTDINDGIEALFRIIENRDNLCDGQIINIGNPTNEASIRELAEMLLSSFEAHPLRAQFPPFAGFNLVESSTYYGKGYQDVEHRTPSIKNARRLLNWKPEIGMDKTVADTLDFFLRSVNPDADKA